MDDTVTLLELPAEGKAHASHTVLAIAEGHTQVTGDRGCIEHLLELVEMSGTLVGLAASLRANPFG